MVGQNAGKSKLTKIRDLGLEAISEDEFLDLIAFRDAGGGELDEDQKKKLAKERDEMEKQAAIMAKREKEEEAMRQRKAKVLGKEGVATKLVYQRCALPFSAGRLIFLCHPPCRKTYAPSSQLWTTKYAPAKITEICGNKAPVQRLGEWLENW